MTAWNNAVLASRDGIVRDPMTQAPMRFDEPWDMGHVFPYAQIREDASRIGLTRSELLDLHNNRTSIGRNSRPLTGAEHWIAGRSGSILTGRPSLTRYWSERLRVEIPPPFFADDF